MNVPELIRRKREGGELAPAEIAEFIGGYVEGRIPEYQVSALLMAIFFRGMSFDEAAALTRCMMTSGRTYDLSHLTGAKVDKHSTGGVGDKVSLILAPLAAAAGLVVPMVSGRGLGHTGGTLDKLDAIPGYRWALSEDEFVRQLGTVGCAIIGQTPEFVPADRKLYALRDVTATVESIPLICASILSKKAASGTRALVMDVKFGSGAFMPTVEDSRALARQLVGIGNALALPTVAMLTRMDRPLGRYVGNALEVIETVEILRGAGPEDSTELTILETAEMLVLGGVEPTVESAIERCRQHLADGSAMAKFQEWVAAQGGDPRIADDTSLLQLAPDTTMFNAAAEGFIEAVDTRALGVAANTLGAGRLKADDQVDLGVGFEVLRQPGDPVRAGDPLLRVWHRNGRGLDEARRLAEAAYRIGPNKPADVSLVLERIG
ncbi:MAG: thymidine phosphorylase [Candidatus Sumerlaeia bacterium]|nr:thymidine phosphorylase [Candidatus Sumerlaeia bacterium]